MTAETILTLENVLINETACFSEILAEAAPLHPLTSEEEVRMMKRRNDALS